MTPYRRAFERYRRFVTFFYNHHADLTLLAGPKLIAPTAARLREAFVRLIRYRRHSKRPRDVNKLTSAGRSLAAEQRGRLRHLAVAATLARCGGSQRLG
jgi:hypothetical protein